MRTALQGDVVVAAAFMSYAGPFPSEYRAALVDRTWLPMISDLRIPASEGFSFSDFLADPSDVRDWNILGLPADAFSTENGVMTTRGRRWPLMIDPQARPPVTQSCCLSCGLVVTSNEPTAAKHSLDVV